jgi:microcystin-dependent protein
MLITNQTPQDYWFGPLHLPANAVNFSVDDTSATSLYLNDDTVADAINTLYTHTPPLITVSNAATPFPRATGVPTILHGDGSPEGIVYAGQGSIYMRRDNTGGTQLYQKTTGIHVNTGWIGFAGAVVTTPTGAIASFGGAAAPAGWLICDGSAVSRTTYADLFAAVGSNFGNGDGTTTFNLPDMRGRAPVGFAATGGHSDVNAIGKNDGQSAANRRPKHRTSITDPGHTHSLSIYQANGDGSPGYPAVGSGGNPPWNSGASTTFSGPTNASATGVTAGTGVANDAIDTPSYLVLNHIIKT